MEKGIPENGGASRRGSQEGLRAYSNNLPYCGRLQSPIPALSAKNVLKRSDNHASGRFLAWGLGLELFARPHNDPVIRIGSKLFLVCRPAEGVPGMFLGFSFFYSLSGLPDIIEPVVEQL